MLVAGGAALYFVSTVSVHDDPATVPSTAAAAPAERYSGAVDEARRLARALVVGENLPGLSVAVALDGEIVWAEGFGWADVERRAPELLIQVRQVFLVLAADRLQNVGVRQQELGDLDSKRPRVHLGIVDGHAQVHVAEIAPVEPLLNA
jgi:hypothetical protein